MNDSDIDDAVLAVAKTSWGKVAMLIVKVADKLGSKFSGTDEGYHLVASRIDALVRDGRLHARGDTREWRFSEVRRPNPDITE